ncbi:TPA: hypothetical protein ACJE3M_000056 [Klebsiella quasipneumoniae]
MTDITELAQREKFEAWVMTQICISKSTLEGLRTSVGYRNSTLSGSDYNLMWNLWKAAGAELVEALEKAQGMEAYWKTQCRGITDHCEELQARIAELEREQEHLRPVGVMSEKAFHRLENSECRFIALWPRPGIFLPRKRPGDGVIVYARTVSAVGIKVEAE